MATYDEKAYVGTAPFQAQVPLERCRHGKGVLVVFQNVTRTPNCSVRGSPTAVTVLNAASGLDGYEPVPNEAFRVTGLIRSVRLKASIPVWGHSSAIGSTNTVASLTGRISDWCWRDAKQPVIAAA
jgi:hypothetical protein